jgi:hypothetical protein
MTRELNGQLAIIEESVDCEASDISRKEPIFMPFSIATGLLAGLISKKAFAAIWSKIDDREPKSGEQA